MSIAKRLPDIAGYCLQRCPLCMRDNRIVVKGVFVKDGKHETHPDAGYSFCNCRSIFYTKHENVWDEFVYEPINGVITAPDVFFVEWGNNPYTFPFWDIRKYRILWDMDSLCEYLEEIGYKVISRRRDFDVASKTPMHFHIEVNV